MHSKFIKMSAPKNGLRSKTFARRYEFRKGTATDTIAMLISGVLLDTTCSNFIASLSVRSLEEAQFNVDAYISLI